MSELGELDAYLETLAARDLFSGVALITRGETALYARAFGMASRAWSVPNTLVTRFDTASVTKLFTAVAVLQLIDRGHFSLETRAIEFLALEGTAISRDVSVFHLLTHTSGIADDVEEEDGESYEEFWKTRPNHAVTSTEDFLPQFAHKPPNFAPGQRCRYCNVGYVLLGLMIERATGMSYREYVRQHVFSRAGMDRSDFLRLDRINDEAAEGADPIVAEGGRIVEWKRNIYAFPPIGSPDSGAYVTAGDLDRFLRAVTGGRLLSPERTRAFLTPHVPYRARDGGRQMYGFGIWFRVDDDDSVVWCQKEGINAGVSALVRVYPGQDVNVVLLSNLQRGVWEPANRVHELLLTRFAT